MVNYYPLLLPGQFYHVFNRGNNRENVFYKPENTLYFLKKYTKYLFPLVETYTYCLLPNHFHLLIRVRSIAEILTQDGAADLACFKNLEDLARGKDAATCHAYVGELVSEQFRLLFMSYAKAINKQEKRVGSLFQKNFKRLCITSDPHLHNVVLYIHANPQLHRLRGDFRNWTDSSYATMLSDGPTKLCRTAVLNWFGGKEQFIHRHKEYIDWKTAGDWLIED